MKCNGWNHPPDCSCGWGGDTGGGHAPVRRFTISDGRDWSRGRSISFDTFVNPNARCPVCGASVFYYQSPYGGRVFFDQLGPPWPKHPCTDSQISNAPSNAWRSSSLPKGTVLSAPASSSKSPASPPIVAPGEWRPLVPEEPVLSLDGYDRVPFPKFARAAGKYLYIPSGWWGVAPIYWRWREDRPGMVDISSIAFGDDDLPIDIERTLPGWLRSDEEFHTWLVDAGTQPSPERMNAIGWSFSFTWRFGGSDRYLRIFKSVNFELARRCFELSEAQGYWAAMNNLGVMFRDGHGVEVDPKRAFSYFERACEALEPISLLHLARCYSEGFGCTVDIEMAEYLKELAGSLETNPQE